MGQFGGDGSEYLDFSSHTYEQLRAAVYAVSEEAVRVAGNEWADLKRRVNERVGTLHVAVSKLTPQWNSPAGQAALDAMRTQLEWMAELARVAGLNEARLDDVQTTRIESVIAMRALDSQPGGPVPPGTRSRPAPSPGPAPNAGGWVDPVSLDWRQPQAVAIANRLYGRLAIAAASLATPPSSPQEAVALDDLPGGGAPRSRSGGGGGAIRFGPSGLAAGVTGPATPSPSTGWSVLPGGRGPAVPAAGPGASRRVSVGGQQAMASGDSGKDVTIPGSGIGATGTVSAAGKPGLSAGRGVLRGRPLGVGTGSTGSTTAAAPLGRVIGGGLRPAPGTPIPPTTLPGGSPPPPGGIPTAGGMSGQPGGPSRMKPGYERAEPDTFVDSRSRNPAGGKLPASGEATRFAPLPGMVGQQKSKPAVDDQEGKRPGSETRSPEGFPETLQSFTHRDGVTFEVRRSRRGV